MRPDSRRLRVWAGLTALAAVVGAPIGATVAVGVARAAVTARDGDPGDGIGYVVPGLLGAAGTALLVLVVAAAVLLLLPHLLIGLGSWAIALGLLVRALVEPPPPRPPRAAGRAGPVTTGSDMLRRW